jgi:hypothetical protein
MIPVFIPVIIFIVFYAYRLFSDETSAIEAFRAENSRDEVRQDEIFERKSNKSEDLERN